MSDYTITGVAGYGTVEGIPYINGKPATPCEHEPGDVICTLGGTLQPWLCPECGAHLAASGICLNACHLTTGQYVRFGQLMNDAKARAAMREIERGEEGP